MTIKSKWVNPVTPTGVLGEFGGGQVYVADGAITADAVVYYTGANTAGRPKVKLADADAFVSVGTPLFIARYAAADAADVICDDVKILQNVVTTGSTIGNPIYPSATAGGWALAPGSYGGRIGTVLKVHASTGIVILHPQLQTGSGAQAGASLGASSEVTITAGGAAALTGQFHTVDTNADGATDDLDTLSGLPIGTFAMLKLENAARNVVIRDTGGGTGNIRTPGAVSITLDSADDHVLVFRTATNYIALPFALDDLAGAGLGAVIVAENTDVLIPVPIGAFAAGAGTWTLSRSAAGVQRLRRTAGASAQLVNIPISIRQRTTASKGLKITGLKVKYNISAEAADEITVTLVKTTMPATAAGIAAATDLTALATFDTAHDTAGERGAQAEHTMSITLATPTYLNDAQGSFLSVEINVDDTTGGNAVFDLHQILLVCSETLVDAA